MTHVLTGGSPKHSQERIDEIGRLWNVGRSAAEIGRELGMTRNAVIGAVHRWRKPHWRKATVSAKPIRQKPQPFWTDERIAGLKSMHANGDSYATIAVKLGCSRNVVIGRAKILGFVGMRSISTAMKVHHRKTLVHKPRRELAEPEPKNLTLLELTDATCKWPVGAPDEPARSFCGHRVFGDGPYCEHHHARAYVPPKQRNVEGMANIGRPKPVNDNRVSAG